MFYIEKTMEIAGSHKLNLSYDSKCSQTHGHNWLITVYCKAESLVEGMVVDFTEIKRRVHDVLDHKDLNNVFEKLQVRVNPTAENIAAWVCDQVPNCYKVEVQESAGNIASYQKE